MIRVQLLGRFRMYDETRCLNEEAIHSPMITKLLNDGMEKMETVLGRVLPAGTAVTKYSPDQYLFLLPCLPYEEAKMMTKQIVYRFYTADRKGKVQVLSDLKELYQEPRELEKIN